MQPAQQPAPMAQSEEEIAAAREARDRQRSKIHQTFTDFLKSATDARLMSGIEEEWQLAEDLFAGIEPGQADAQPQALKKPANGKSRVVVNITASKTNVATSQIIRRVLPGDMKPWAVAPTPVPEFDEAMNAGGEQTVAIGDGTQVPAKDAAKAIGVLLRQKAERMTSQIEDWLRDTAVYRGKSAYAELRRMIKDGGRVGTGVIKGPFPTIKEDRRWSKKGNVIALERGQKLVPRLKAISVRNCYPDPSCGDDIHAGSFFIERDYLTPRQVRDLSQQPGYEPEELATVLAQGPQHWSIYDDRYKDERQGQVRVYDRNTYETFYLYADLALADVLSAGFQIPALTMAPPGLDGEDAAQAIAKQIEAAMQLASIPVMATMINGRIVKVVLNPSEKGGFPYRFFRWEPVEGRPYGKGVPIQIATPQLMLTSAVRAMLENAGQSAGPQVVYADGVVQPVDGVHATTRNKHWTFTPSEQMDDVRKAFGLFVIPSVQEQLFNIVKAAQEWADQLANIPLLMQGITGATPDTLGGMEMLEANAASPLLDIAKEYDEVLAPLISDFYDWAMQDPEVSDDAKGDFQCKAIGSTVLVHRDRKALALQQVVGPMAADPGYGLSKERVGEQIVKSLEIEPESVQLTEEEKTKAAEQPPPVDPRVEASRIKAESDAAREASRRESEEQERRFRAEQAEMDRIYDKAIADINLQIQAMESAQGNNLKLEQIRATLAEAAMNLRTKRELFAAEHQFAITDGDGRGL